MKKTDKKIDNAIIKVLTDVCETAKDNFDGFQWLTHFVDFNNVSSSLTVVCVFETNQQLDNADIEKICQLINSQLLSINIKIKNIGAQVKFDTEEDCSKQHGGNWDKRFAS